MAEITQEVSGVWSVCIEGGEKMFDGVILIGVGRNLNRAIRTCYVYGVYEVYCLNCSGEITGNLYSARDRVRVHQINSLKSFDLNRVLALERLKSLPTIDDISFEGLRYLAVGGESTTLRFREFPRMARIPTYNDLCLTTEGALAIGL